MPDHNHDWVNDSDRMGWPFWHATVQPLRCEGRDCPATALHDQLSGKVYNVRENLD